MCFLTYFLNLAENSLHLPVLLTRKVDLSVCTLGFGQLYYDFGVFTFQTISSYLDINLKIRGCENYTCGQILNSLISRYSHSNYCISFKFYI